MIKHGTRSQAESVKTTDTALATPKHSGPVLDAPEPVAIPDGKAKSKGPVSWLRATKYDIVDPTNGNVRIHQDRDTKVRSISPWLQRQIDAGLVKHVDPNEDD